MGDPVQVRVLHTVDENGVKKEIIFPIYNHNHVDLPPIYAPCTQKGRRRFLSSLKIMRHMNRTNPEEEGVLVNPSSVPITDQNGSVSLHTPRDDTLNESSSTSKLSDDTKQASANLSKGPLHTPSSDKIRGLLASRTSFARRSTKSSMTSRESNSQPSNSNSKPSSSNDPI